MSCSRDIEPVAIDTGMTAQSPAGRLGEVDDVAAAVAYLSSAHAGYITGEVMAVNGGWWWTGGLNVGSAS